MYISGSCQAIAVSKFVIKYQHASFIPLCLSVKIFGLTRLGGRPVTYKIRMFPTFFTFQLE